VVPDRAVLPTCGRFANQSLLQSDGSITRVQRAETLGPVSQITRQNARAILQSRVDKQNQIQRQPKAIMKLSDFVTKEWRPNAGLALKESSVRYYDHLLERHILPAYGSHPLSELNRAGIESILANLRQKGHASGTLRGVRATFSTVLKTAVERGYLEKNVAHGIRIRSTVAKRERRHYSPAQVQQLLLHLTEPCRTVVHIAVLTGLRIGEILALRWKRIDLLRKTLEVAETFSEGEFGSPKTRSSHRVITYSHVIPDSQRRAVERVSEVLFSNVLELEDSANGGRFN
jgi:integrase